MSIDVPKIIYIYVIILALMYFFIINGNIIENVSSFTDRKNLENPELSLETDYNGNKVSLDYIKCFVYNINRMKESELKNFFDESYYNMYSNSIKKTVINKVRIKDSNNESYIELVSKTKNESGQDVYVYNILVVKKGLKFPDSFNILSEEESLDKNKSIDIHVIEISPYNYVLQIPDKEFVG